MQCKLAILPDKLQPVVLDVPEGSATAAALGWESAAALSELGAQAGGQAGAGQLYECCLASIQTPDSSSQEICQQIQSIPVTWLRVHFLQPVTAVAVGEHHRSVIMT